MLSTPQNASFRSIDGYAGFRSGQAYQLLTPDVWEDGTVTAEMPPHAPSAGRAKFDEKQCQEWWERAKNQTR